VTPFVFINVGKSADFAILEKNITRLSPDDIAKTKLLMTVLQGDIVFSAEE
jgi:predicted amidohydrolase YtcJ